MAEEQAAGRLSDALMALFDGAASERISIGTLLEGLGARGFGLSLVLFAICAALPPGIGSLFGFPIMLFAAQMMAGRAKPWLPKRLADKTFAITDVRIFVAKVKKPLDFVERFTRPRLSFLTTVTFERFLGLVIFFLAGIIALPGPLTNMPPAIAIGILGIAMAQRDGLLVLIGLVGSVVAAALGLAGLTAMIAVIWIGITEFFGN